MPTLEHTRSPTTGLGSLYGIDDQQTSDLHSPLRPPPPSPFDNLATEVIEQIFLAACSDVILPPDAQTERVPYTVVLGLVCRTWFSITTAYHPLWASFTIESSRFRGGFGQRLFRYLQKSGPRPLCLQVQAGTKKTILDILDILVCYSERWKRISFLFQMKYKYLRRLDPASRLPLLEYLYLEGPWSQYGYPKRTQVFSVFGNTPSLNHVSFKAMNLRMAGALTLPWDRLSTMDLDFYSFAEIQPILQRLSRTLTTLTLHRRNFPSIILADNIRPPTLLENLHELRTFGCGDDVLTLICPSLKRLHVCPPRCADVQRFLDNSSCALTHLELKEIHDDEDPSDMLPIVRHPSLATLRSICFEGYLLTEAMSEILVLDTRNILTALEALSIDTNFNWRRHHDLKLRIDGLRNVVRSRTHEAHTNGSLTTDEKDPPSTVDLSLKNLFLTFCIDTETWGEWEDEELEELRQFSFSRNILVHLYKQSHKSC